MTIDEILDLMDEMLDKATSVPFSQGKCLVSAENFRNCISDIRLNMPSEVKQAKLIVADRKVILNEAKKESEEIIRKAEERAKFLVSDEEVVKNAQTKATELITDAQAKSKEMKAAANQYADNILDELEELIKKSALDLRNTRTVLKQDK